MLLTEQELLKQQENAETGSGTAGGGSTGGIAGTDTDFAEFETETGPGISGETTSGSTVKKPGVLPGAGAQVNVPDDIAASGIPADIPGGEDDDIIARQLREAALKETDPELREKLWEEYRKYKQGL